MKPVKEPTHAKVARIVLAILSILLFIGALWNVSWLLLVLVGQFIGLTILPLASNPWEIIVFIPTTISSMIHCIASVFGITSALVKKMEIRYKTATLFCILLCVGLMSSVLLTLLALIPCIAKGFFALSSPSVNVAYCFLIIPAVSSPLFWTVLLFALYISVSIWHTVSSWKLLQEEMKFQIET